MKTILLSLLLLPVFCKAQSKWVYDTFTDAMSSKTVYTATLSSTNQINFSAPYDGGSTAILNISFSNGSPFVTLSVTQGQFNTGINGMNIDIKFDDNKPEMFRCGNMSSGAANKIYFGNAKKLIKRLKEAKNVIIQAEFYQDGDKLLKFDASDFKWDH